MLKTPGLLALSGLLAALAPAAAQEPVARPPTPVEAPTGPPPVKLALDLGFVNSAGNTDVTTLSVGENLEYRVTQWQWNLLSSVVYGRTGDSTTAEQIKVSGRVDRRLVAVLHAFVGVSYERNRFAGIGRRFEEFGGLALRLIDRPSDLWTLDTGSSVNQQRSTINRIRNFAALRFAMLFRHNFAATTYLQQSIETLPNLEDSRDLRVNSETALVAPLSGRLALKLSYAVKYDKLPEPGFQKSDRIFTTGIQIGL